LPLNGIDTTISVIGDQVSKPYIDITLRMMEIFGVTASHDNYQTFYVPGKQSYQSPNKYLIEGDASSASYFFAGAAVADGKVLVHGLGENSIQGDIQFLEAIEKMGASTTRYADRIEVSSTGRLTGVDLDLNHIPDAAMTLAVIAIFAEGRTTIRNIYNWRVKETDRMHAIAEGLTRLGAKVTTTKDTISIDPPTQIQSATINPYGDHRVAMSFSLAALSGASITIQDPNCTGKTFPNYFEALKSISFH
jgi:3-phosphoshikimate 1-carboxyvinyltransferase